VFVASRLPSFADRRSGAGVAESERRDFTHLRASAIPSSNLGAGTHRTMATCVVYDDSISFELCEVSVADSPR